MILRAILQIDNELTELGSRTTHNPDPLAIVNLGHLIALLREHRHLLYAVGASVVVQIDDQLPRRIGSTATPAAPSPYSPSSAASSASSRMIASLPSTAHLPDSQ